MIPYTLHNINSDDIESVVNVLNSDWLTQGSKIQDFENLVSEYCNVKYATAVNSGTSALHLSCLVLGLGKDELMWTTPNSFVASANCALYCGATVDFVDINQDTYNMDVSALKEKLERTSSEKKPLPKIVMVVHFSGQSCEMKEINRLSKKYGFKIIEDATHAIGGKYCDSPIGSCDYSDLTVFSFHPAKNITTGEGGMILTKSEEYHNKLQLLRSHGVTRDENLMESVSHGPWYYQQIDLGYNYRLSDIHAALGCSQIKRLDEFINKRTNIFNVYNHELKELPIQLPLQHIDAKSAHHLFVIRLKLDKIKKTHRQIFEELRENGIAVNLHYIPIHTQPYYKKMGFNHGDFPQAESYYSEAISLPIYSSLEENQLNQVIVTLKKIIN